jgi:protein LSM14
VPQQQPQQQPYVPQQPQQPQPQQQPHPAPGPTRSAGSDGRHTANLNGGGSVQTAAASLETVERALGDLRNSTSNADATTNANNRGGGGRRGGSNATRDVKVGDIRVPTTDFDFEGSNALFDKTAVAPPLSAAKTEGSVVEEGEVQEDEIRAYNPGRSFFDSLSSSTQAQPPAQRGTGRGRGGARHRREEERERNVATFGEPGGVGLMGPGAYVGGWGGYGRRGGGRGRRGQQGQTGTR